MFSPKRLPFFYGWVIVVVAFVTMAIGVNARTSFSLLFPPLIDEFGWQRGLTAGAFSFGFATSAVLSPLMGRLMDRSGPRVVMEFGVFVMAAGLLLAPLTTQPWHFYMTIGLLVGGGSVCVSYSGQSLFLPNWFVRRPRLCRQPRVLRRRHRLDRAVSVVPIADRALRLAHGVRHPRHRAAGRARADQPVALPATGGHRPAPRRR